MKLLREQEILQLSFHCCVALIALVPFVLLIGAASATVACSLMKFGKNIHSVRLFVCSHKMCKLNLEDQVCHRHLIPEKSDLPRRIYL